VSERALVLAYHAIERGHPPLCIEPALFAEHLDAILESGLEPVSLTRLADALDSGGPAAPSVAITFDDGCASVFSEAVPLLREREIPATVFCVAGYLGGRKDWPTEPPSAPRLRLASAGAVAEAAGEGIEIGSHGLTHLPLALTDGPALEREVVESRQVLEEAVGAEVSWFAHPGDSTPGERGRELLREVYSGAVAGGNRAARPEDDRWALPRIEMHYLRRPGLLRRALLGGDAYLALRRLGARARRLVRADYVRP
jgi:peptidoglycan/xylan/chitin deacetylase (PgdA/CDA1 family)